MPDTDQPRTCTRPVGPVDRAELHIHQVLTEQFDGATGFTVDHDTATDLATTIAERLYGTTTEMAPVGRTVPQPCTYLVTPTAVCGAPATEDTPLGPHCPAHAAGPVGDAVRLPDDIEEIAADPDRQDEIPYPAFTPPALTGDVVTDVIAIADATEGTPIGDALEAAGRAMATCGATLAQGCNVTDDIHRCIAHPTGHELQDDGAVRHECGCGTSWTDDLPEPDSPALWCPTCGETRSHNATRVTCARCGSLEPPVPERPTMGGPA